MARSRWSASCATRTAGSRSRCATVASRCATRVRGRSARCARSSRPRSPAPRPPSRNDDRRGDAMTAKKERHVASHVFNVAVLVVGVAALAWLLNKLGWDNVKRVLGGVGGWFAVIVALDVAALACEAAAIREFMRPEARMVAYWRV